MFHQLLTPVGGSLFLSFIVAVVPIAVVLVLLGLLKRPAWQASLAGLLVAFAIAVLVWQFPLDLALNSTAAGAVFALWPVMWIVFTALLLYNIAVASGRFDAFRDWVLDHLPNDRRIVLVVIGFCFGCLLEGISGFGTPVAITSALLILVGFPPLEALTFTLIFNTAPVAFGGAWRADHRARPGHRPPGGPARRDGRPAVADLCDDPAVLCDGAVRRRPLGEGAVAGAAGLRRQLRHRAVRGIQLPGLRADRRAVVAVRADRDLAVPAGMAPESRAGVRDRGACDGGGAADAGAGLAGLGALDRGVGGRDRLDALQGGCDRADGVPLAGTAQRRGDHAVQRQAVCGELRVPAAGDRDGDPDLRDHHRGFGGCRSGAVLRGCRQDLEAEPGSRS